MVAADFDVVILCGGLGTRLRKITGENPKTMVTIGGKPFLEFLVEYAAGFGFERFIFCAGYKAEVIRNYFSKQGARVTFSEEPVPLGTAGALKFAERHIQGGMFLVLNGDSYCPVDLNDLINAHERFGGIATLAVVPASSRTDGGYIRLADDQSIIAFQEKKYEPSAFINAGVYVFDREILKIIPEGKASSLENDVFPALEKNKLYAFKSSGALVDIGTPGRLEGFRNLQMTRGAAR